MTNYNLEQSNNTAALSLLLFFYLLMLMLTALLYIQEDLTKQDINELHQDYHELLKERE